MPENDKYTQQKTGTMRPLAVLIVIAILVGLGIVVYVRGI